MSTASPEPREGNRPAKVGKSGRNKPRARLVCANCRSRKVKCDAEKLSAGQKCSHCQDSDLQCVLYTTDGRRRGRPSQQSTAILQDRINFLESALKETAQVNTRVAEANSKELETTTGVNSFRIERDPRNVSSPLELGPQMSALAPPTPQREILNSANERRLPIIESEPQTITGEESYSEGHQITNGLYDAQPSNCLPLPGHETSLENLTSNGNTAQDGQSAKDFTFYGPTTQPHIQSPSDEVLTNGSEDDISPSMPLNMDSLPLRKTLLNIYFRLQTRFQILINENLFMSDWALQKRSQYYSSFLEDAILAFSTRHSTSSSVRKLGENYAARCKKQIATELDDPKIGSLQGLLLLGDFEATRGNARIGWTYCVIASGLMVDLGIHVDCSHLVKQGKLTTEEANARQVLLLSGFVYAAQWSLYLGRPNPIPQITLRATQQAISEKSNVWVLFCTRMLDIMDILNCPASQSGFTRETSDRLLELNSDLRSLLDSVQPNLSSDIIQLGELDVEFYSFHMQYCGLQILLHRAILKSDQAPRELEGAQPPQLLSEPVRRQLHDCVYTNAIRIAQLISSYQRIFGVDEIVTVMIDNIFIASVALISHIHQLDQEKQKTGQTVQWLYFLSNVFQKMGKHFPATSRMRSCLAKIVENSSLSSIFPPVAGHASTNPTDNSFDIFNTQDNYIGLPRLSPGEVLADGLTFNYADITSTPGNGLYFTSAWNMTPSMFDTMTQTC